jgi:hypothetical protein
MAASYPFKFKIKRNSSRSKKAVAFQSPLFTVIKGDGTTSKFAPSAIRRRISKWKYFVCKEEKEKKPPTISK